MPEKRNKIHLDFYQHLSILWGNIIRTYTLCTKSSLVNTGAKYCTFDTFKFFDLYIYCSQFSLTCISPISSRVSDHSQFPTANIKLTSKFVTTLQLALKLISFFIYSAAPPVAAIIASAAAVVTASSTGIAAAVVSATGITVITHYVLACFLSFFNCSSCFIFACCCGCFICACSCSCCFISRCGSCRSCSCTWCACSSRCLITPCACCCSCQWQYKHRCQQNAKYLSHSSTLQIHFVDTISGYRISIQSHLVVRFANKSPYVFKNV